jgi:hypothetical protein
MNSSAAKRTLSVLGLSVGTSAALIVLFALCAYGEARYRSV